MTGLEKKFEAVFFDVDGVLIDSMLMKGEAFADLFPEQEHDLVVQYHQQNGGMNREIKIANIFRMVFGKAIEPNTLAEMTRAFSELMMNRLPLAPLMPGVRQTVASLHRHIPIHAVSAAPATEVSHILNHHDLLGFFSSVHGSPTTKEVALRHLLSTYSYEPGRCVFVGDTRADEEVSAKFRVPFIRVARKGVDLSDAYLAVVEDLADLDKMILGPQFRARL